MKGIDKINPPRITTEPKFNQYFLKTAIKWELKNKYNKKSSYNEL